MRGLWQRPGNGCRRSDIVTAARLSVAPMMDWTDPACRGFHRLLSRRALLYTEMVTRPRRHPWRPCAASGFRRGSSIRWPCNWAAPSRPTGRGDAHRRRFKGYDEINLNVGCWRRVQSGCFGAVLMTRPGLVAEWSAMIAASPVEVVEMPHRRRRAGSGRAARLPVPHARGRHPPHRHSCPQGLAAGPVAAKPRDPAAGLSAGPSHEGRISRPAPVGGRRVPRWIRVATSGRHGWRPWWARLITSHGIFWARPTGFGARPRPLPIRSRRPRPYVPGSRRIWRKAGGCTRSPATCLACFTAAPARAAGGGNCPRAPRAHRQRERAGRL